MGNIKVILKSTYEIIKSHQKRQEALFFMIILSLPFSIRFNSLLIILLTINSFAGSSMNRVKRSVKIPILLTTAPFIFSLISLSYSENIHNGVYILEKSLSLLAFPLIFILKPNFNNKTYEMILNFFIAIIVLVGLVCLINSARLIISNNSFIDQQKLSDREYYYFTYINLANGVNMNPIYLGMYVNLAIALVIERIYREGQKISLICIFIFLTVLLFLLSSKINIIVYFTILIILLLKTRIRFLIKYAAPILLLSILLLFSVKPIRDRVVEIDYFSYDITKDHIGFWNGANLRLAIWQCALLPISENWIFGVGTGSEKDVLINSYKTNNFKIGLLTRYNTHNQFLEFSLRFGLIGAALCLVTNFLFPIVLGYKLDNRLFIFSIIVFMVSLTEVIFATQKGMVFYSLFINLFLNHNYSKLA